MPFEENHSRIRKKWATKHGPHQAYGFEPFAAHQSSDETTIPQTITQNGRLGVRHLESHFISKIFMRGL
jgi:hypothetical protein